MKSRLLTSIFLLSAIYSLAQEETEEQEPKKFTLKGYIKDMASFNFYGDSLMFQNLIHNRLNFAWYATNELTFYMEVRTRLLHGDFVSRIPNYAEIVDSNNDYFDLSANLINEKSVILNTMMDRFYLQWAKNNWEIKLGRQRINWGINLAWNPNDWFNAYSFFDFDYEERPGSDAVRVSRYTGAASSIEVAAKISDDIDRFVGAAMWKVNKWDYDFQFLGGLAQGDLAAGTGWAGNLGTASFKGEMTWFHKVVETEVNPFYEDMFLGAISVDYSFPNSLYLNGSLMFNSEGTSGVPFNFTAIGLRPGTVRDLSLYRWSGFVQSTYQINPLLYSGLAFIGYPGSKDFFINPSITISAMQNLDVDVVAQLFFGRDFNGDFGSVANAVYLRLKWSF
jgi:hypothetical protein